MNASRELVEDACQSAWLILLRCQPVVVIALDVPKQRGEGSLVDCAMRLEAGPRMRAQALKVPLGAGDPDDRHAQTLVSGQRVQRQGDLLEREIARDPEERERVGAPCLAHLQRPVATLPGIRRRRRAPVGDRLPERHPARAGT